MVFITKQTLRPVRAGEGCAENNRTVTLHGMVHSLRVMGGVTFLTLRGPDSVTQCVCTETLPPLCEEAAVQVTGVFRREARAPGGFELAVEDVRVLSRPAAPMPVPISRRRMDLRLDTELPLRPVALRNLRLRSAFQIQAVLCRTFRTYLDDMGFTEIHSPKLVHAGAEGGSNLFRLDYFGQKAFLAQSPQFYKQMMVGVFERVYEVAPVFRAEKHATTRHLNEYTSLDLELGFINSFQDLMALETGFLQKALEAVSRDCSGAVDRLGLTLPEGASIPALRFDEAKHLASERYGYAIQNPWDLEPEEEIAIGRYAEETWGSEFVFITHYPAKKRPFYVMDDPEDPRYTLSFDLLFRGMEVTTGGQRIHDWHQQVEKLERRGMDPAEFEDYLLIHKHGMPPHGGLGIGLERLTMKLCALENIRAASLFPRDRGRLTP